MDDRSINVEERFYFVAGATSELGNRVLKKLTVAIPPTRITCMIRSTSQPEPVSLLKSLGVRLVVGDITDVGLLASCLSSSTVYIDMTHPKYYHQSIDVVRLAGVKRAFFVTTTGIFSKYNSASDIYKIGESRIKNSSIPYTILRPSLIYGTDRDRNMTKLLQYLATWPMFPVFGRGECLMQPVYVEDLADGIATAILQPEHTANKEYNLCGPTAIPYLELLNLACNVLGRKVLFVHIPHGLAVWAAALGEKIPKFPIKKEQVMRLLEDKQFDISAAQKELHYNPRTFTEGITSEVDLLRSKKLLPLGR